MNNDDGTLRIDDLLDDYSVPQCEPVVDEINGTTSLTATRRSTPSPWRRLRHHERGRSFLRCRLSPSR